MVDEGDEHDGYDVSLKRFGEVDAERNNLLARLVEDLKRARKDSSNMSSDLERERDANRKLQSENKEFQMLKSRRAFVVVLIDADADDYMFREEFLNHPDGGQKAADEIAARIEDHMASDGNDIDVVIRAFANLKGLKTGVLKRGKMGVHVNPERFVQSFSQRSGMFDFVDVGDAKEGVDHKIRENVLFFLNDIRCKRIFSAVCHDKGYLPGLSQIASGRSERERITFIASGALSTKFMNLGFPSPPLQLHTVFAPGRIVQHKQQSPPSIASTKIGHGSKLSQGLVNANALTSRLVMMFGDDGERIDKPLLVDPNFAQAMARNSFCGYYYLRGYCNGLCGRNHTHPALTAGEYDCLWFVMRNGLCNKFRKNKICDDPMCIYGHQRSEIDVAMSISSGDAVSETVLER